VLARVLARAFSHWTLPVRVTDASSGFPEPRAKQRQRDQA